MAVYTGSLVDPVVVRSLCGPIVLDSHENPVYQVAYLFSGYAVADLTRCSALSLKACENELR